MKASIIATLCFIINITIANAQVISQNICNTYPASVISRLYDIAKHTTLTEEQQQEFAERILQNDKILVSYILEGKTVAQIDSIKRKQKIEQDKFAESKNIEYSTSNAEKYANIAANAEMKYIQKNYQLDNSLYKKYRLIQFNKYRAIYTIFKGLSKGDSLSEENLYKNAKIFDSLSYTMYESLQSSKYINDYIKNIQRLNPKIADTSIQKIKKHFYIQVDKNPYTDKSAILLDVLQHTYPDTIITAGLYKKSIEKQAAFLAATEKYNLINVLHVSKNGYDSIFPLVKQKNYQQVLLAYTYGGNATLRDSLLTRRSKFYDSTIIASLLRDGSIFASNQFAIALKYKTKLKLRPSLTDTLLSHAMYVQQKIDSVKMIDPFAKSDFKEYEAKQLNLLLTEDQYTQLLTIKNRTQAYNNATDDWEEMEKRNIATNFNKDTTTKQLYNYYLVKLNAYYRMADDKIKQESNARIIKEKQPKALRMLAAAKKLDAPVNDNSKIKIQW